MEIHEGLKGPLFLITSTDGQSCSGQTPDISWENFQKKGCPRSKMWHGKRYSCKIDGVELFGFKNSYVQRLLRELAANLNGMAERSLLSSSFCNGASSTENTTGCTKACTYPDLLAYLATPQIKGKRSVKPKTTRKKSDRVTGVKKLRSEEDSYEGKALKSQEVNQKTLTDSNSLLSAALGKESDIAFHSKDFCRSVESDMRGLSPLLATEDKQGESSAPEIKNLNLCAPDTLEGLEEKMSDLASYSQKDSPQRLKDENMSFCGGLTSQSHIEGGTGMSLFHMTYDISGGDSVGQEVAESMMTVLLPQALPLLKNPSTEKHKTTINPSSGSITGNSVHADSLGVRLQEEAAMVVEDIHAESDKKMQVRVDPDICSKDVCTSPNKETNLEGLMDSCANLDEHFMFHQIDFKGNDCKAAIDGIGDSSFDNSAGMVRPVQISLKDNIMGQEGALNGSMPLSDLPDFVPSSRKYDGPLSESIICRNFGDISASEDQAGLDMKPFPDMVLDTEPEGTFDLVGCYVHPMNVTSILLTTQGNEIYICVLCGILVNKDRNLYIYKVPLEEPGLGVPYFIGHSSITLPASNDIFGREIDTCGLQFTPDGQFLVLLNSIKAPYCRKRKFPCHCSICESACGEENALKIVRVEFGYLSVVAKLKGDNKIHCIIVCEPNRLLGVAECGRLHLWVMNSTWSGETEEFVFPRYDCISPCVVELKRIPNSGHLVVGHNAVGEFALWDIFKRILVSRFSASSSSLFQFVPVSVFSLKSQGPSFSTNDVASQINTIMALTKLGFSEKHDSFPLEGNDMGVWLLISTESGPGTEIDYSSGSCNKNPPRLWRLALLVKNMVILGSALDPRAAAIGVSAGKGIMATHEGLVYMWELSSGTKLCMLQCFKDQEVSCIASDNTRSRVLALAGDRKLLVYRI